MYAFTEGEFGNKFIQFIHVFITPDCLILDGFCRYGGMKEEASTAFLVPTARQGSELL